MLSKIKALVKKNDSLYVLYKCLKNLSDAEYITLVRGYYDSCYYNDASVLVRHYGNKEPNKLVVGIYNDFDWGLCAMLFNALSCLDCVDTVNAIPTILWSKHTLYYEASLENETNNVFEYFFKPLSDIKYDSIFQYRNVLELFGSHSFCRDKDYENIRWFYSNYILNRFAYLYKKYIQLNDRTSDYMTSQIINLFGNFTRIIGVHVRGTDYGIGFKNHPIKIQPVEHAQKVKELLATGKYDKVFLATDDLSAIELFEHEFSDNLIYYKDTFRTGNDMGPHSTPSDRPLHHYKLGLEVLRDIYTLANCCVLICGVSNVSFSSRYVNLALGKRFDDVIVLDNGINKEDSKKAQKVKAELKEKFEKRQKSKNYDLHKNP